MTSYPNRKDTTATFSVVNGVTSIDSAFFAKFFSAILAIENELGVSPSGVYTDLVARLEAMDSYGTYGVYPGDITAAALLAHSQNTDTGTTSTTFQIDTDDDGVNLKNVLADLQIRNALDTDYSSLFVKDVNCYTIKDQSGNYAVVPANLFDAVLKKHLQNTDSYTTSPYFQLNTNGIKLQDGYSKTALQVIKPNGSLGDLYCNSLYASNLFGGVDAATIDGYNANAFLFAGQPLDVTTINIYTSNYFQPLDSTLTNLSGLVSANGELILGTGLDTFRSGKLTDGYVDSLSQSKTHNSPDTDTALTSLHHTLGTNAFQAAAGDHQHNTITTLSNADGYVLLSTANSFFMGKISDGYISSLSQSKTHDNVDTDLSTTSLHHTLGTSSTQAAAGDHTHSTFAGLYYEDGYALISGNNSFGLSKINDGYVSSLSQSKTHDSPDTDISLSSLHHTLGTGQYQAAAGNDSRFHNQNTDAYTTSNTFGIGNVVLSGVDDLSIKNSLDGYVNLYTKNVYLGDSSEDSFIYSDNTNSYIKYNIITKQWEVKNDGYLSVPINHNPSGEPIGFESRLDSYISFDNSTRTFSIAPKSPYTSYFIWDGLKKYEKTQSESIILDDEVGLHYIYFIDNVLTEFNTNQGFDKIIISFVYWDGYIGNVCDERHGLTMDYSTHQYLHNIFGTTYNTGLSLVRLAEHEGTHDSDAYISLTNGSIYDEDIEISITRSETPTEPFEQELGLSITIAGKFPIYYRLGSGTNNWRSITATDLPVYPYDGIFGSRIGYNYDNGGVWTIADSGEDGYFIGYYIVATNNISNPVVAIMGQRYDSSLLAAEGNNLWSSMALGDFPFIENKPLYTIIVKTDLGLANNVKCYIESVLDLRNVANIPTGSYSATIHSNLIGLTDPNSHPATAIGTSIANFNNILDITDSNVQLALDKLDNHTHSSLYQPLDSTLSDLANLSNSDGYVLISGNNSFGLSKITDGYVSSLSQNKTHDNVDTDLSVSSIHHTLGTGATEAAAGDHLHSSVYQPIDTALTNLIGIAKIDGYVLISGDSSFGLSKITDGYVESLSQYKTHDNVDTDLSYSSIHHTLGTGQYQAASGNDARLHYQNTDSYTTSNTYQIGLDGPTLSKYGNSLLLRNRFNDGYSDLYVRNLYFGADGVSSYIYSGNGFIDSYIKYDSFTNKWQVKNNGSVAISVNLITDIATDTSNFNSILSSADTNVQLALDTLDNHGHDAYYQPLNAKLTSLINLPNSEGYVIVSSADSILLSKITDGYVSSLSQSKTHDSPDTDNSTSSLHHTLGTSSTQAAVGNHTHVHSSLSGLTSGDDHTQYVSNTIARTITANHTFDNAVFGGAPFSIGSSSSDVLVVGLNADRLDGFTANQFVLANDSRLHTQNTDTGTTQTSFQLQSGSSGVKLQNTSGKLAVRTAANDGYANIFAKDAYFGTGSNNDVFLYANTSDVYTSGASYIKFNAVNKQWEFKNDGYLSTPINYNPAGEPIGFENQTDSYISFDDSNRTFTIRPKSPATSYTVWHGLKRFVKTTAESIIISNTVGLHYIIFDRNTGILKESLTFPAFNEILVGFVYWTGTKNIGVFDERHGLAMDSATHEYLHGTVGARYQSGLTLTRLLVGTGAADTNAQISLTNGIIHDEDIEFSITRSATPINPFEQELGLTTTIPAHIPIYYRLGSGSDNWTADAYSDFICRTSGGTSATRMAYNLDTGGTWSLAQIASNNYGAMWIFATNNKDNPIIAIMGQGDYNNLDTLQTNAKLDSLALGNFVSAEIKILYRLALKTNLTYANAVNAYIDDVQDLRSVSNLPAGIYTATAHSSLSGNTLTNSHPAAAISTTTTNFNGILTTAETDVQLALDKIDDHTHTSLYQPLDTTLTGLAAVISADGYLILSTGLNTFISGKLTDGYVSSLSQSKTHSSPDTDSAITSLHHTLGTGAFQAAAGNDSRLHNQNTDAYTTSNTFGINYGLKLKNDLNNLLIRNYNDDGYTNVVGYLNATSSDGYNTPLIFNTGTLLYTPKPGAVEYSDGYFHYTGSNSIRNLLSTYTSIVPETPLSSGKQGQFACSDAYAYICYTNDSWIRIAKDPTWI
jgi:hypothetical protein